MSWGKKCDYCKIKEARFRLRNVAGHVVYCCIDCEIKTFEDMENRRHEENE